jgi:geranylgeranyl diphosphate synthase type II
MTGIEHYQSLISEALERIQFPPEPAELYEPIRYTLALGGKRMRPVLVLMGADLLGGNLEDAINPALGIEVFHNFTLLHDDIMDEAPLRRGKATVHTKWNSNIAILSGDVMFVESCRLISKAPAHVLSPVLEVFFQAAGDVCEGQQWDMNFEAQENVSLPDYIKMIRLKTAVLLGASLQIGALCANANEKDAALLYEFGCHLGVAFQLQDDVLDVFGDPAVFGKQAGGDILSNKKTYLKLRALEKANQAELVELKNWYSSRTFPAQEKVAAVTRIFENLQVREDAEKEMNSHLNVALDALKSVNGNPTKVQALEKFAYQLMDRVK